jgi:hypothetical protein
VPDDPHFIRRSTELAPERPRFLSLRALLDVGRSVSD